MNPKDGTENNEDRQHNWPGNEDEEVEWGDPEVPLEASDSVAATGAAMHWKLNHDKKHPKPVPQGMGGLLGKKMGSSKWAKVAAVTKATVQLDVHVKEKKKAKLSMRTVAALAAMSGSVSSKKTKGEKKRKKKGDGPDETTHVEPMQPTFGDAHPLGGIQEEEL